MKTIVGAVSCTGIQLPTEGQWISADLFNVCEPPNAALLARLAGNSTIECSHKDTCRLLK